MPASTRPPAKRKQPKAATKPPADDDELEPITKYAYQHGGALIEEMSKRFRVKYEVAANELLRHMIAYMSEVGEDHGIHVQPIKAVVNIWGMPEEDTPHPYEAMGDLPPMFEGDKVNPKHCIHCDKPKSDPLHKAIKLPAGWLE